MKDQVQSQIDRVISDLEFYSKRNLPLPVLNEGKSEFFNDNLSYIKVRQSELDIDSEKARLSVDFILGRESWIDTIRYLLKTSAERLYKHKWSIAYPAKGYSWPISDHPVFKLNYFNSKSYNFLGGYESSGTEIMMPISPKHLIITHIGKKIDNRLFLDQSKTKEIIKLLVQSSHRWVISKNEISNICYMKPRVVDSVKFKKEQKQWQEFNKYQIQVNKS